MYKKYILAVLVCVIGASLSLQAQTGARRLDTTVKVGKAGYRVSCPNKNPDRNTLSVKPLGFEKEANEVSLEVKGRVPNIEIDDINRDGFPDLLIYIYSNDSLSKGNVIGIISEENKSLAGAFLPDIYDDPKLRIGYKGNDSFFLMEGNLMRRFPVYPTEGAPAAAAAGNLIRQVQYQLIRDERGSNKFKVLRSYDFVK